MNNFEDKVRLDPCFKEQMSNIGPGAGGKVYKYEAKEFTVPSGLTKEGSVDPIGSSIRPAVTKEDLVKNMDLKWLRRTIKK